MFTEVVLYPRIHVRVACIPASNKLCGFDQLPCDASGGGKQLDNCGGGGGGVYWGGGGGGGAFQPFPHLAFAMAVMIPCVGMFAHSLAPCCNLGTMVAKATLIIKLQSLRKAGSTMPQSALHVRGT